MTSSDDSAGKPEDTGYVPMWRSHWRTAREVVLRPRRFFSSHELPNNYRAPLFYVFTLSTAGSYLAGIAMSAPYVLLLLLAPSAREPFVYLFLFWLVIAILCSPFAQIIALSIFVAFAWIIQCITHVEKQCFRSMWGACCYPYGVVAFVVPCFFVFCLLTQLLMLNMRVISRPVDADEYSAIVIIPIFVWFLVVSAYGFAIRSGISPRRAIAGQLLPFVLFGVVFCILLAFRTPIAVFLHGDRFAAIIHRTGLRWMGASEHEQALRYLEEYAYYFPEGNEIEDVRFRIAECRYEMVIRLSKANSAAGVEVDDRGFVEAVKGVIDEFEQFLSFQETYADLKDDVLIDIELQEKAQLRIEECYKLIGIQHKP